MEPAEKMEEKQRVSNKKKWLALSGGAIGYGFDAVDFMVLALAIPLLIKDWGISMAEAGAIASATMLGAAIAGFLWGPFIDRWGRKKSLAIIVAWFGVWSVACAFAQNSTQLSILRFICGLGLGGEWAIGATLVSEFFPGGQRAKATSLVQSCWSLGYLAAIGLQIYLVPIYGWRALFIGGGLAVFGAVYIWLFVPESPMWLAQKEKKPDIGKTDPDLASSKTESWTTLFKGVYLKATVLAILLYTLLSIAYWGSGTWIPAFLAKERGMNLKTMSGVLLWFNVTGFFAYYLWGWIADKYGRRITFIISPIIAAGLVAAWVMQTTTTAVFVMGVLFTFVNYGLFGPLGAIISEQFTTKYRGLGVSIVTGTGKLVVSVIPFTLGVVADKTSLMFAIGILAVIYVLAGLCAIFFKETRHIELHKV